jgi:hypothetical protein
MTPIVIDYEQLCETIRGAEKKKGKVHTVRFHDGYKVGFSIEQAWEDFWVRKIRIEVARGEIHPGAIELLALAFKVPVSEHQMNRGGQLAEFFAEVGNESQNYSRRK